MEKRLCRNKTYDIEKIHWFISKIDRLGDINPIAIPVLENAFGEMEYLNNGPRIYEQTREYINEQLNELNQRKDFRYFGATKGVIGAIEHFDSEKLIFGYTNLDKKTTVTDSEIFDIKYEFENLLTNLETSKGKKTNERAM